MHATIHWLLDGWRPNEWLWYFPQFHEIIFGMTTMAILLLAAICIMQILNLRMNRAIAKGQRKIISLLQQKNAKQ